MCSDIRDNRDVRDDLRPALFGSVLRDRILARLTLSENGLHLRELARQIDASATASMMFAGPTIQPVRHPIIRYSFDAEPTEIVRSAMPGKDAGCTYGRRS